MAAALRLPAERDKTRQALGLDLPELPLWLPMIVGLGSATAAEILDILQSEHSSISQDELRHVLLWAEALSLAHQRADVWEFDTLVSKLLG
jgi:hypothetical protein